MSRSRDGFAKAVGECGRGARQGCQADRDLDRRWKCSMNHTGAPGRHAARLTNSYGKGIVSKDLPIERERLRLLERDSDPHTMERRKDCR
jgi:hypothetical protein